MGVALGAQYFLVDGGTGGSLSSSSAPPSKPGSPVALQGAFGLPESPLHAPLFEAIECPILPAFRQFPDSSAFQRGLDHRRTEPVAAMVVKIYALAMLVWFGRQ